MKIPLNQILVRDRLRTEKGNVDELAASLQRIGQIHPVLLCTIDPRIGGEKTHRLVAGERRFLAAEKLGWTEIEYTTREQLTDDELFEIELEENVKRKDMTWQERTLSIAKIHKLKCHKNWAEGQQWAIRETSEMLGIPRADIGFMLMVAAELNKDPKSPCWQAASFRDAWRIIPSRELVKAEAELQRRAKLATGTAQDLKQDAQLISIVDSITESAAALQEEEIRYYANPHNPPGSFEAYWKEKCARAELARNTVYLSSRFFNVNCLAFLREHTAVFDHIITDPPYAIDMDMLAQENTGMENIDTVRTEHNVKENIDLLLDFVKLAFFSLKEKGTLIMWTDAMVFSDLHVWATDAGFSVQRWPFTWIKSDFHSNQAAQYNMTKCTEIALVARKGGTLLTRNDIPNYVMCPFSDEMTKKMQHPFAKPFAAWRPLIEAVSLPGQTIYDPFMGEGSGVLSMLRLNRNVIATELVEQHYNAGMEQIRTFYKQQNGKVVFK